MKPPEKRKECVKCVGVAAFFKMAASSSANTPFFLSHQVILSQSIVLSFACFVWPKFKDIHLQEKQQILTFEKLETGFYAYQDIKPAEMLLWAICLIWNTMMCSGQIQRPRCPRKRKSAAKSWVILSGRQAGSRHRCCKMDDMNFIMFCIKNLLFGRRLSNFPVSSNIKEGISLIFCDGLSNVLLATLKSLQIDFHTVPNRKQWLPGSQEINAIKCERKCSSEKEVFFFCCTVVLFHIFKSISIK